MALRARGYLPTTPYTSIASALLLPRMRESLWKSNHESHKTSALDQLREFTE